MPRVKEIDILKGILIMTVIIGHTVSPYSKYIYWFHMPAFFMVSGLLFNELSDGTSLKPFMLRKTYRLLVPYIAFFLVIYICSIILNLEGMDVLDASFWIKAIYGGKLLFGQYGVFWFITCLWVTLLTFSYLKSKIKNSWIFGLLIMVCFLLAHLESSYLKDLPYKIFIPWNADNFLLAIAYFYLGYKFKYKLHHFFSIVNANRGISLLIVILIPSFLFLSVENYTFDMKYEIYGNVFLSLFIPTIITLSLLVLIKFIEKIQILNIGFVTIGKYSLSIMYLHLLIKEILLKYDIYNLAMFLGLSLLVPILISLVCEKNRYTAFLFLGNTRGLDLKGV